MAEWPAAAVYSLVALATVLENFLPPAPADTLVALAAFVTSQGATTPLGVFAAAWGGSTGGAIAVYYAASRFGRTFFATGLGKRLLTPDAVATMEREYLRFGAGGIFFVRLLPGLRSIVAPFAGLVALPPLRALPPMIIASGLWYGGITLLGVRLGANWETIKAVLARVNTTLGVLAALVVVAVAAWILLRRRQRRRERLWDTFHQAFQGESDEFSPEDPAIAAVATLLVYLIRTVEQIAPEDRDRMVEHVRERWQFADVGRGRAGRITPAEFSRVIAGRYERPRRVRLARRIWWHGFRDGLLQRHEEQVMRRIAELLGLSEDDLAEARRTMET